MKKQLRLSLISSAVLLAATTTCFAASSYKGENYKGEAMPPCPTPLMIHDGFYLGAQVGYDSYRVRNSYSIDNVGLLAPVQNISGNPQLAANGWVGGLFAGYGQFFDTFYLGGELFVNDSGAESSFTNTFTDALAPTLANYTSKVTVGTSYGISLLPGLKLNDASLAYVRLGYERARIKGKETFAYNGGPLLGGVTTSTTDWRGGFQYGVGLETTFAPQWDVRTEFTHVSYGSFSSNVSGTKFSPSDNQFTVGLSYKFA